MTDKPQDNSFGPLKKLYKLFILPSAVYFSLTVFLTTLFYYLAIGPGSALDVKTLLWYWVFSMAMAALGLIFRIESLVKPLKVLFHWLGMIILLVIVLLAAGSGTVSNTTGFILAIGASVLYFVFAGIYVLAKKLLPEKVIGFTSKIFIYFSYALFLSEILTYAVEVAESAPTLTNQFYFFLFAVCAAAIEYVFRMKSGIFFRVLIHFIAFMLITVVFFFILAHAYVNFIDIFLSVIVIAVVYLFVTAVVLMITGAIKKSDNGEEKYRQQFNR